VIDRRNRLAAVLVLLLGASIPAAWTAPQPPEYEAIQQRLARGWNTWNTRSVLSWSVLPEGFGINLAFKQVRWLDEGYLRTALIGRGEGQEQIRPGPHTYGGRYTRLDISWEELDARVEAAHVGQDLVLLITPRRPSDSPVKMIIETAMYWNRPGKLSRTGDSRLRAETPQRTIEGFSTADHQEDYYVETSTPYLVVALESPVGISTGVARDVDEIRRLIDLQRQSLEQEARTHGKLSEAYIAVQSGIAWNTIFEPRLGRVVSTVGRLWNQEYGGYCLFGWDNFFLAYMTSLTSRDLAMANVIEHLGGATEEGFIPNDNRGNGSKSWDRSQPPVGGLMVREIYKRYPERWFLEAAFDPLLDWNRWWLARRNNGGLLSYGSHPANNPFDEPSTQSKRTAGYESGMDDPPM
jgi:hypothetical protein